MDKVDSTISFDEWKTKEYKFTIWDRIYILWRRYIINPYREMVYYIKRSIGRVRYGVSAQDIWSLDYFIADVLFKGVSQLKLYKHGTPATKSPVTGEYEFDEKRWDDILTRMMWGFNILRKCGDDLLWGGSMDEECHKRMEKMDSKYCRVTTREEERIANEAFDLLKEHFFGLWD